MLGLHSTYSTPIVHYTIGITYIGIVHIRLALYMLRLAKINTPISVSSLAKLIKKSVATVSVLIQPV